MTFVLKALADELKDLRIPIEGVVLVGRGEDCDVCIQDPRLSRKHARFLLDAQGLVVEDLGSPNGTFVNGDRVKRKMLRHGDRVRLGRIDFEVEGDGVVTTPAEPALVKAVSEVAVPSFDALMEEDAIKAWVARDPTIVDFQKDVTRFARQAVDLAVLFEVGRIIREVSAVQPMLSAVIDLVLKAVDGDRGYVGLVEDDGAITVAPVRHRGIAAETRRAVALSHTLAAQVLGDRVAVLSADVAQDERFQRSDSMMLSEAKAVLAVPILVRTHVLGLMVVECGALSRGLAEPDLDLLSIVAASVGVAIENVRLTAKREETIRALREAQTELVATQEQLVRSEQMAVIGRLASGIAHEVKNQLSPFLLAEMIARDYPNDPKITSSAEIMLEAQQHILDLVNELRAFAQGTTPEREREPQDFATVVEGVLRFMMCDAKLKATRKVSLDVKARPWVDLNARSMRQVLVNLLRNAADAVAPERGAIVVRVVADAEQAILTVTDNGSGIPAGIANRIFEPFFSTKGERGLGLGLDISKKLVEEHGGTLNFETQEGQGTTFTVTLPVVSSA